MTVRIVSLTFLATLGCKFTGIRDNLITIRTPRNYEIELLDCSVSAGLATAWRMNQLPACRIILEINKQAGLKIPTTLTKVHNT